MNETNNTLFSEADRVEIRFEKTEGVTSFKRNIAASDAMAAVRALAALVSHLSELVNVHPGEILAKMAALLLSSETDSN